jgi:hypothetical protein
VSHDSLLYKYEFLEKEKSKLKEDHEKRIEDNKKQLNINDDNLNHISKLELKLETLQDSHNITNNKLLTLTEEYNMLKIENEKSKNKFENKLHDLNESNSTLKNDI